MGIEPTTSGVDLPYNAGQMDLQVVASGRKLNLRRLALGGQTDSQVSSQVHTSRGKKNILMQTIAYFIG